MVVRHVRATMFDLVIRPYGLVWKESRRGDSNP
jgi:hypothetical protein